MLANKQEKEKEKRGRARSLGECINKEHTKNERPIVLEEELNKEMTSLIIQVTNNMDQSNKGIDNLNEQEMEENIQKMGIVGDLLQNIQIN